MKDKAIVCNIGHFDNEIQIGALERVPGIKRSTSNRRSTNTVSPTGIRSLSWRKAGWSTSVAPRDIRPLS